MVCPAAASSPSTLSRIQSQCRARKRNGKIIVAGVGKQRFDVRRTEKRCREEKIRAEDPPPPMKSALMVGPRKIWHFLRPFMIFYDIPDIALLEKPMICVWPLNLSSKRSRCGRPDPPKPLIEHCGFLQQIQTSLVTEKRQSNNW